MGSVLFSVLTFLFLYQVSEQSQEEQVWFFTLQFEKNSNIKINSLVTPSILIGIAVYFFKKPNIHIYSSLFKFFL